MEWERDCERDGVGERLRGTRRVEDGLVAVEMDAHDTRSTWCAVARGTEEEDGEEGGRKTTDVPGDARHKRTQALVQSVKPRPTSLAKRKRVLAFVRKVVDKALQGKGRVVHAYTFGSVPLETYLPDGDIDVCIFAKGKPLPEDWVAKLQEALLRTQEEQGNTMGVRNVTAINAEVKLCKCNVDNILVDFSASQLSGLSTLLFLEEVNLLVGRENLVKDSIILVKAWCFYESRIMGAQHALLSTYALETMVLYIISYFHEHAKTPLEVLHLFLRYFSEFDWEQHYLSLEGVHWKETREACPLEGEQRPLLSADYLRHALRTYCPVGEAAGSEKCTMTMKFLNVMDPLLPSNNLGRSVSHASFRRIRKALARGASELDEIFGMSEAESLPALEAFFGNTIARVGKVMELEEAQAQSERNAQDSGLPQGQVPSTAVELGTVEVALHRAEDSTHSSAGPGSADAGIWTAPSHPGVGLEIVKRKWNSARECLGMSPLELRLPYDADHGETVMRPVRVEPERKFRRGSSRAARRTARRARNHQYSAEHRSDVPLHSQRPPVMAMEEFPPLGG